MQERIYGFEPVWRSDAQILILGSMPSVESLKQSFYYAHPRNAFWPMMAQILGEPRPETIEEKKDMLVRHRIALWDTVGSCEREGSLDSAIRGADANDFAHLFQNCPQIKHILFNGATAYQLYCKLVAKQDPQRTYHRMPSTSPAYTLKYETKLYLWKQVIEEVLPDEPM